MYLLQNYVNTMHLNFKILALVSIESFGDLSGDGKTNAKPHSEYSAVICIARNIFNKATKMYFALIFNVKHTFSIALCQNAK